MRTQPGWGTPARYHQTAGVWARLAVLAACAVSLSCTASSSCFQGACEVVPESCGRSAVAGSARSSAACHASDARRVVATLQPATCSGGAQRAIYTHPRLPLSHSIHSTSILLSSRPRAPSPLARHNPTSVSRLSAPRVDNNSPASQTPHQSFRWARCSVKAIATRGWCAGGPCGQGSPPPAQLWPPNKGSRRCCWAHRTANDRRRRRREIHPQCSCKQSTGHVCLPDLQCYWQQHALAWWRHQNSQRATTRHAQQL